MFPNSDEILILLRLKRLKRSYIGLQETVLK